MGRGYETGGYKCECRQGYEYPFEDFITYYDGQLVEAEFTNLVDNNITRFHTYQCRIAGSNNIQANTVILLVMALLSILPFLR